MRHKGVLVFLVTTLATVSPLAFPAPEDGSTTGVPDVWGQFIDLKHHGEAIGWTLPESQGAPDPNPPRLQHYQGVVRYPGRGVPILYVTQNDYEDTDPQGGKTGGYLNVVRLASRPADGERLRSNLQKISKDTEETTPPAEDTWIRSIRFNGIGVTVDGVTLRPYEHPGGMAIEDNILFVAVDTPDGAGYGNAAMIVLFDLGSGGSSREYPQPIQALPLPNHQDGEFVGSIDNLAVTRMENGRYLIWINGNGGQETHFFHTNLADLRSDALALQHFQDWDPESPDDFVSGDGHEWPAGGTWGWRGHQSSTFVRQGDGTKYPPWARLFLIGMRNDLPGGYGDDLADLYEVVNKGDHYQLIWKQTLHFFCVYDGGGGPADMRIGSFVAANNAYVSPTGELILYSIQHDDEDWADPDFVRMGEFRHREVNREDGPLRKPGVDASGPYQVAEGSTVSLAGVGTPPADRPWVELYDDDHGWCHDFEHPDGHDGDRSIVVDYDYHPYLELRNFERLDDFNDKTTSVVWRMPVGLDAILYDDRDYEDRHVILKGTGKTEYIHHLDSQIVRPGIVEHPGKKAGETLDFNGKTSSMKFDGTPYSGAALTFVWDLDGDGVFGETGSAATRGDETGATPNFSAALADGPSTSVVVLRVCSGSAPCGSASTTVQVLNVAPTLTDLAANAVNEDGTTSLTGKIVEPGATDALRLDVDWGDPLSPDNVQAFSFPAGTSEFTLTHRYLDDNPTGTSSDSYTIKLKVADDDGGTTDGSTSVTVKNVAPTLTDLAATAVNEDGTTSLTGRIVEPGTADALRLDVDWGDPLSPNNVQNLSFPAGASQFTLTHRYLDDNPTGTASDSYTIKLTVADDDGGTTDGSTTVTVKNVAPTLTDLAATAVNEDGTTSLTGKIVEPGTADTLRLDVDWGDPLSPDNVQTLSYAAGTSQFTLIHRYLDDNPTGTASDSYTIKLTVADDDGGATDGSTRVSVGNAVPVVQLNTLRDETGLELGTTQPVALVGLGIQLTGKFTDAGTLDTHTASIVWGDATVDSLGSVTEALAGTHAFAVTGNYSIVLRVVDDDTGVGTTTRVIRVADAGEAAQAAVEILKKLSANGSATKAIASAIARLVGNSPTRSSKKGGTAANGAFDDLERGNLNAALVKLRQAVQYLADAQAADSTIDVTATMNLLALAGKSVVIAEIAAEAGSANPDLDAIALARAAVAAGDGKLRNGDAVRAVETYRKGLLALQD